MPLRLFMMCLATTNSKFHRTHFTLRPDFLHKGVQGLYTAQGETVKRRWAAEPFRLSLEVLTRNLDSTRQDIRRGSPKIIFVFLPSYKPTENPLG